MGVDIVYWLDKVGGILDRLENIDLKPFGYRMAPIAQWKALIANKDTYVEKGKPCIIEIKPIVIPENTIVNPLNIMRHALGVVLDAIECGIPEKVEEKKCISEVLFLPIESGIVKKGDLIGVFEVHFIKTGLLARIFNIGTPDVKLREEEFKANLTWRDDGNIHRKEIKSKEFGYVKSDIGLWELLIADEDVKVKAGEAVRINIKEIRLPPNTVITPLYIIRNAYGTVLDVVQLGKPSRVEEEKRINQVIFLPIENGKIEKGDLIGVINVYYVGVKDLKSVLPEKSTEKVRMVYRSNGGIIKKEIEVQPFGYRYSPIARWECLIADENKKVEYGKPTIVKIKRIEIPKNTIVYPLFIMRHAFGTVIDLYYDKPPKRVEDGIKIDKVVFLPIHDGEIKRNELLGVVNLYSIGVGIITKIRDWYKKWVEMSEEEILIYARGLE